MNKIIKCRKFREKSRQFAVEGIKLLNEVLKSGIKVHSIFLTAQAHEKHLDDIKNIENLSCKSDISIYEVSSDIMSKISDMTSPPGIVCLCDMDQKTQSFNKKVSNDKIAILENIQDPHNLGTIFRICDALGIRTLAITKNSCDVYNPKVLRGSMGSVFRLDIFLVNDIIAFISSLKERKFKVYASTVDKDSLPVSKIRYDGKIAVIVGNEGNGIDPETIGFCDEKITIPISQEADSLNAAVAAGIIIWEMSGRGGKVSDE